MKNLFLFFILLSQLPIIAMEVTFFNIGQGNCTLVTVPGQKTMLVDAGSSSAPLDDAKCAQAVSNIVTKIIAKSPDKKLLVIASHADKDHINKLVAICKKLLSKEFSINFLLGGSKENYEATKIGTKFLAFLSENQKECPSKFASDIKGSDKVRFQEFKKLVPSYCTVLSALINQDDGNDNSLVLKVSDGTSSALLTGDATGHATDEILADTNRKLLMKADSFQVSHHGAGTHNCTNRKLLLAVNPKKIFISAGLYGGYNHPRYEVIKTLVEYCIPKKLTHDTPHLLSYYRPQAVPPFTGNKDEKRFNLISINSDDYCTAQTAFPIYNTLDAGTINYNQTGVTIANTQTINDNRGLGALKGIQTPRFDNIRFLFFNNMELESADLKNNLTALPAALEYLDLRNNSIGHFGIEHLITLYKNHKNKLTIKLTDNRAVPKAGLTTICKKATIKTITSKNRIVATFSHKGRDEDTVESLEFSRGKSNTDPAQHAQALAYAQDNDDEAEDASSNKVESLITETKGKKVTTKKVTFDLSHDEKKLYIERSDDDQKGYSYPWKGITDVCLLFDKTQTVAGITTKDNSTLFDFEKDAFKDLKGTFKYTSLCKKWKTIGKEFWTLDKPGTSFYHERTPFSMNGKFVVTVSDKDKCINIYETDQLVFDPETVRLHATITQEELKNDLGKPIADIKRIEFCDNDHSLKFHFTDKSSGELRYILDPH